MALLTNSDFELSTTRETAYWTPAGGPFHTEFGEISTPYGWTVWWREGFGDGAEPDQLSGRPEVGVVRLPGFPDPKRIKFGASAVKAFTFWRRHDMGVFQQVRITKNVRYKFSVYAHSWYSRCSTKPHDNPLDNDCQTPINWAECWVTVGIDPFGGTDPYSDNVVWGNEWQIYGTYIDEPLEVIAEAQSDTITVFTHSWNTHALKHNDTYWDSASLEQVSTLPREYERTYVLYPQDVTLEELQKITKEHYEAGQLHTIGGSADDSAIDHPNLKKRTIIVYWSDRFPGGKSGLQAFFDTYYPGVDEIVWVENGTPPLPPTGLLLWQCDLKWRNYVFGDENCNQTVCQSGCFICCLAMSQRFYDIKPDATPVTVDEALGPSGYNGCVANWAGNPNQFASALRLRISRVTSEAPVLEHLQSGGCVMAEVPPASYEHFVLITKVIDGRFWMLDPYKNIEGWYDDHYGRAESWRIITHITPVSDQLGKVGLHIQREVGDWRGLSEVVTPMKFLAGIENIVTAKQLNGNSFPWWRQWVPDQGTFLNDQANGASRYVDTFRDSMERVLERIATEMPGLPKPWFGVESLNETYACFDPSVVTLSIPFDRAFIQAMLQYTPEIAPLIYCAAVGNIDPSEYHTLLDLFRECEAAGGAGAYHPYWFANSNESGLREPHWEWLAGRWQGLDDYLTQRGIKVRWALGEMGAVGGYYVSDTREMGVISPLGDREPLVPRSTVNMGASDYKPERVFVTGKSGYVLLPGDGWKSSKCYGGNWARYEADLLEFNDRMQAWNETHDMRAYGGTIFTTGGGDKWKWFEIAEQQIARLIAVL